MEGTQIKENQRLDYIDDLKGFGIILVVIGHHLVNVEEVLVWIYSFHMPLFFIIAGYLSAYKNDKCNDIKSFIINKTKGLMYPYVTFSLINIIWYIAFYIITPLGGQPKVDLKLVFIVTLTTLGYQALWFLPTLLISTVLFNIINKTKFSHIIHILIMIFGCVVCVLIQQTNMDANAFYYFANYISRLAVSTSFIYIGSLVGKFLIKMNNLTEWICIVVCGVIASVTLVKNLLDMTRYNLAASMLENPVLFYISAISNSILFLLIFKKINPKKGLLNYYGKNSLIIMATHMGFPVEIAWIIIAQIIKFPVSLTISSMFVIVIEFIIMTICILLINKYFRFIIKFPDKSKKNIEKSKSCL